MDAEALAMTVPGAQNLHSVLGVGKESPDRLKISVVTPQIIHTDWDFAFNHRVGLSVFVLALHSSYSCPHTVTPNVPVQIFAGLLLKWMGTYDRRNCCVEDCHHLLFLEWQLALCVSKHMRLNIKPDHFSKASRILQPVSPWCLFKKQASSLDTDNIILLGLNKFSHSFPSLLFPTRNYLPKLFNSSHVAAIQGDLWNQTGQFDWSGRPQVSMKQPEQHLSEPSIYSAVQGISPWKQTLLQRCFQSTVAQSQAGKRAG